MIKRSLIDFLENELARSIFGKSELNYKDKLVFTVKFGIKS